MGFQVDDDWDAICIGSGLGCLAAAATLAQAGRRVLILERLANFGGAATIYRHGRMTMEASLHATDGRSLFDPGSIYPALGLTGRITPVPAPEFYEVRGGPLADPVQVPPGLGPAEAALRAAFPGSAKPLAAYFRLLGDLDALTRRMDAGLTPRDLLAEVFTGRLPRLLAQVPRRLGPTLDRRFGRDEAVKLVLGALLGYFDDDPARLSFLLYAGNWARYCAGGAWNLAGGSAALTRALVAIVRDAGGEARRRATATAILTDAGGAAAGVTWQDAEGNEAVAVAPVIFGGAAPAHLAAMLPEPVRPRFLAPHAARAPSISLFALSLGLTRPAAEFGLRAFSTVILPDNLRRVADMPAAAHAFAGEPGTMVPPYIVTDGARIGTGLGQPDDLHVLGLTGVDRLDWWRGLDETAERERRKHWIDALVADLDRRFPGLSGAVAQAEIATARTMMNRLGTPEGGVYGHVPTPGRVFGRRPSGRTAVPGLYLASAFTLSGGFVGALRGGRVAALEALERGGRADLAAGPGRGTGRRD